MNVSIRMILIALFVFALYAIATTQTAFGMAQEGSRVVEKHIIFDEHEQYWVVTKLMNSNQTATIAHQRPATEDEIRSFQEPVVPTLKTEDVKTVAPEKETPSSEVIVAPSTKQLAPTPLPLLPRKFSAAEMKTINRTVQKAVAPHIKRIAFLEESLIGKNTELNAKNSEIAAMRVEAQEILDSSKKQIESTDKINATVDRLVIEKREQDFYLMLRITFTAFIVLLAVLYFSIQNKLEMKRLRKRVKFLERTVEGIVIDELPFVNRPRNTEPSGPTTAPVSSNTARASSRLVESAEENSEMASSSIKHVIPTAPLHDPTTGTIEEEALWSTDQNKIPQEVEAQNEEIVSRVHERLATTGHLTTPTETTPVEKTAVEETPPAAEPKPGERFDYRSFGR